jgi:hypothetical protein
MRFAFGGLVALLVFASAALAAIPRSGKFSGSTDQAYPDGSLGAVSIKMTHGGRRIKGFEIAWLAACDNGFTALSQGTHAAGTLSGRGRFRGHGSYFSDGGNLAETPYTAMISDRLRGRFVSRRRAEGTFRATAVLRDAAGQPVSTCATPALHWQAGRGRP